MELRKYFSVLIKWWWLILASTGIAAIASLIASLGTPRLYQSRTTLMVGTAIQNPNPNQTDIYTGQALAQSYTDLVRREPVLRDTLQALGLDWNWPVLQSMVTSRVVPSTQLLEITVQDTDPQRAKILVDEIAHQLILQSPSAADPEKEAERQFVLSQIQSLKNNIRTGQDEIQRLDDVIASATSARQIQEARTQQSALQVQVSSWQANYAQLLAGLQQSTTNFLSIVEPAQLSTTPVGASPLTNVLVAALIGLVLASAAAFLLEYLDDTIKSVEDAREVLGLPLLAGVSEIEGESYRDKIVAVNQPRSPLAEAYRVLRTNLQFRTVDKPLRSLILTSPSPQEGKSITAANLAVVMAQAGMQVVLVDADFRRPVQHQIFGIRNEDGLTKLLLDANTRLSDVLKPVGIENLRLITSGVLPPNPSEVLGSKRMGYLIEALQQQADIVIYDSPPVLAVADTAVLAARLDGALLVISSGVTRRELAKHSKDTIESVGASLLGVVINRLHTREVSYGYYGYYDDQATQPARRSLLASLWNNRKPDLHSVRSNKTERAAAEKTVKAKP